MDSLGTVRTMLAMDQRAKQLTSLEYSGQVGSQTAHTPLRFGSLTDNWLTPISSLVLANNSNSLIRTCNRWQATVDIRRCKGNVPEAVPESAPTDSAITSELRL